MNNKEQKVETITEAAIVGNTVLPDVPSHEVVMAEIYKWADEIRLPSGYDADLDNLYKRLSVLWHSR